MNLVRRARNAWALTKLEIEPALRAIHSMRESSTSYQERKILESEEMLMVLVQTPRIYLSNLRRDYFNSC